METLIFFGKYDDCFVRSYVLEKALMSLGFTVTHCKSAKSRFLITYIDLFLKFIRNPLSSRADYILVNFPGNFYVPLAKVLALLFRKKGVIFDAFLSQYDSLVMDRGLYHPGSLIAKYFFLVDKLACRLSDVVLVDTVTHADYFVRMFGLDPKRVVPIPVGVNFELFRYRKTKIELSRSGEFQVLFVGNFIPLHGIDVIVNAARVLQQKREILFSLVGDGQLYGKISDMVREFSLKNLTMSGAKALEELPSIISGADVCLGIFGKSAKSKRVIPTKIYQYAAMKKPIITGGTPALKEIFTQQDIYMIPLSDHKSLARAILKLYASSSMRLSLGEKVYSTVHKKVSYQSLGELLRPLF